MPETPSSGISGLCKIFRYKINNTNYRKIPLELYSNNTYYFLLNMTLAFYYFALSEIIFGIPNFLFIVIK